MNVLGTPALSRPAELWTQINAVAPTLFQDKMFWQQFAFRYCDAHKVSTLGYSASYIQPRSHVVIQQLCDHTSVRSYHALIQITYSHSHAAIQPNSHRYYMQA